jgi:hypothetical protein
MPDTDNAETKRHPFAAKWFLNGFPKAGLHLVALMMEPIAQAIPAVSELPEGPWAGTFQNEWAPLEMTLYRIGYLGHHEFIKSHAGYTPDIDRFLYYLGVSHVFIYRDFRDVALSQAYHVLSNDEEQFIHLGRDAYRALGGFDEVLEAVIVGIEGYPGVMARWELYAPWLDAEWVHKVRFEEARSEPEAVAEGIIRYGFARWQARHRHEIQVNDENVRAAIAAMVARGQQREQSLTFRKGNVGDWQQEFTERHKRLFKETDKNGWLVRLEYEGSDDW